MSDNVVLVTGSAGFIGFHLSRRLVESGHRVVGIDNLNTYYEPSLKLARLEVLKKLPGFSFYKIDLTDADGLNRLFGEHRFEYVVNLAAQAGVRYSIQHPMAYLESNLHGFLCILEACRHHGVKHLVYASSSSVYGANRRMPFSVHDNVDHPISFYAASKKANELMAHTYSALYHLPATGLRFFTVYGPYGRPDMALFLFTKAILESRPVDIYNHGKMRRDFTYVDDIVDGIARVLFRPASPNPDWDGYRPDPASSFAPYRVYNIGNNKPVELLRFIELLEEKLGKKAIKNFLPLQDGDVEETYADISDLESEVGFRPATSIDEGIGKFVDWYKAYYRVA
jgi:UDP-glucuronate 4-epimerase